MVEDPSKFGSARPSHYKLDIWREAIALLKLVYELCQAFPSSERYNLAEQIKRSAVSVPSNIAEGAGRGGSQEFIRFLHIARGSLMELDTQLLIATELQLISRDDVPTNKILRLYAKINRLIAFRRKQLKK